MPTKETNPKNVWRNPTPEEQKQIDAHRKKVNEDILLQVRVGGFCRYEAEALFM